jgi:hypothetical protein
LRKPFSDKYIYPTKQELKDGWEALKRQHAARKQADAKK